MEAVEKFIQSTQEMNSTEVLRRALCSSVRELGFDLFVYFATGLSGRFLFGGLTPFFLTNYPPEWIDRYVQTNCQLKDPIVVDSRLRRAPFAWGQGMKAGEHRLEQRFILGKAYEFGAELGLAIPIHGPGEEFSLFTTASRSTPGAFKDAVHHNGHALQLIGLYTHALVAGRASDETARRPFDLTSREKEVLLWAAQGKTNWEISKLIHRSEATVNFHFQHAKRKLGAANRCHAVAKATAFRLISL